MIEVEVETEIVGAILRLRSQPGHQFQQAIFVIGDEGVATLKATVGALPGFRTPVLRALQGLGFRSVRWSRHRPDGTTEWKEFPL